MKSAFEASLKIDTRSRYSGTSQFVLLQFMRDAAWLAYFANVDETVTKVNVFGLFSISIKMHQLYSLWVMLFERPSAYVLAQVEDDRKAQR